MPGTKYRQVYALTQHRASPSVVQDLQLYDFVGVWWSVVWDRPETCIAQSSACPSTSSEPCSTDVTYAWVAVACCVMTLQPDPSLPILTAGLEFPKHGGLRWMASR